MNGMEELLNRKQESNSMLAGFRCLDLTNEAGFICGKILGDLGADIIKVEKPSGDPARKIGPFYHDIPDPEKSLSWFAFNSNKRGITLNIETKDGQEVFKKLVKSADFVIESFPPRYMDGLGLGYSMLNKINPRIIVTSITPFGQTGPYKDYKGADIVLVGMGGLQAFCGDPDRAPLRISFPQAYLHAGAEAAQGTMVAHYYRETTGEGQHIDVSAQESVLWCLLSLRPWWEFKNINRRRSGVNRADMFTGVTLRMIWQCKDGHVMFSILGGQVGARRNQALVEWIDSEGLASDFVKKMDWESLDMQKVTPDVIDLITDCIEKFFVVHTALELYEGALRRGIMLYPVCSIKDILDDPQLKARSFWEEVEHPELDAIITYPGAFAKLTQTPLGTRHRAPLIGEHNEEVYGELGFSRDNLILLKQGGII